jgi:hypothetical protein
MRTLSRLLAGAVLLAWCAASAADLRAELEGVYADFKRSLRERNYLGFVATFQPARNRPHPDEETFVAGARMLDEHFPDFAAVHFVRATEFDEWAGYYVETERDDPNFTTITVYRFQRVDGRWKVSGRINTESLPKVHDAAEVVRLLDESSRLLLPGQPGYVD